MTSLHSANVNVLFRRILLQLVILKLVHSFKYKQILLRQESKGKYNFLLLATITVEHHFLQVFSTISFIGKVSVYATDIL